MSNERIKQGLMKVVFYDKSHAWIRVSRSYIRTLANYWRKNPNFYYSKIYAIDNYQKGGNHVVGVQIGYITRNTESLNQNGINDSYEAQKFKERNIK